MKGYFLRSLAFVTLVIAMTVSITSFAQNGIAPEELKSPAFDKTLLIGKWTAGDMQFAFEKNGISTLTINGRQCPGTWVVSNRSITLNPKKLKWKKADPCSKTRVFEVKNITADEIQLIEKEGNKHLRLTKEK